MKALEKDPNKRFKDASEMRHVLNDFLAGRPIALGDDISGLKTQVMGGVAPMQNGTAVMSPVAGGKLRWFYPGKPTRIFRRRRRGGSQKEEAQHHYRCCRGAAMHHRHWRVLCSP